METTLDNIRNALLIITTAGIIIGIYVRSLNGYFIESIKCKYKYVPGQQSTFEMVINIISAIIFAIYFIALVIVIFLIGVKSSELNILSYLQTNWRQDYTVVVTAFICGLPLIITFCINIMCDKLRTLFTNKMNNKTVNSSFKVYKRATIVAILISAIYLLLNLYVITKYNLEAQDIQTNLIFLILIIACTTNIIILFSLKTIITELSANVNYTFHMNKMKITCKCYLEYKEYFLVLEDGAEKFIKKSEIIQIEKIEINKRSKTKKRKRNTNISEIKDHNLDSENSAV